MLRRTLPIASISISFLGLGCSMFRADAPNRWYPAALTGQLVPDENTPAPNDYVFVDYRSTEINGRKGARPMCSGDTVSTSDTVRVEVKKAARESLFHRPLFGDIKRRLFDYSALVGPLFGTSDEVSFSYRNSVPVIHLHSTAWAFAWGRLPIIRTNYVRVGGTSASGPSDESSFIVTYDETSKKTVVLFVDSASAADQITVACESNGKTAALVVPRPAGAYTPPPAGTFHGGVSVDELCNPSAADDPILVDQAREAARTVGVGYDAP